MRLFTLPKINSFLKAGLLLLIIKTFLGYTQLFVYTDFEDNLLTLLATVLLVGSILKANYTRRTLTLYVLITLFMLYVSFRVGNFTLLVTTMTILAIRDKNIDEIILFIYKYELLIFVVHVFIAFLCMLIGNDFSIVTQGQVRYTLGFVHPNTLAIIVYNLMCMWIWLNYERIRLNNYILLFLIEIAVYMLTKTRTSVIEFLILICFIILFRNKAGNKILKLIAMFIFPSLSIAVYIAIINYRINNIVIIAIDILISGRLKLGAYAYSLRGITFLGQNLSDFQTTYDSYWQMTNRFTFDNLYSCLLINYGIVFIILLSVCFYKLSKSGNTKICIFIILWSLYGITEGHGLYGFSLFPILLISMLFRSDLSSECSVYIPSLKSYLHDKPGSSAY